MQAGLSCFSGSIRLEMTAGILMKSLKSIGLRIFGTFSIRTDAFRATPKFRILPASAPVEALQSSIACTVIMFAIPEWHKHLLLLNLRC